jgi:parallel beta-helix repeat protein
MLRKTVSRMILIVLFLSTLTSAFNIQQAKAEPNTIYVDDDNTTGPWDGTLAYPYQNITSGLENAQAGDTVVVKSGTYAEGQIDVNKSLTLKANGTVVVDGLQEGHVFNITANTTTLKGFTIKNSSTILDHYGILLCNVQNCTVDSKKVQDSWGGVGLRYSTNNALINNHLVVTNPGIWLRLSSHNNTITGNNAGHDRQSENGIAIWESN